jgi:deoxyadenosine/deoxycytidine kinase
MVTLAPPLISESSFTHRVEILGVFGSGKTTLATRLSGEEAQLLAEDHLDNPFWGNAISIETLGYLGYDLSFLLQHAQLVTSMRAGQLAVCDWSFATDWLWASLRLGSDLPSYNTIHETLLRRLGQPQGYLYLRQPPEIILDRLQKRGRENEESFRQYITQACMLLEELAEGLPDGKVLIVGDDTDQATLNHWLSTQRS